MRREGGEKVNAFRVEKKETNEALLEPRNKRARSFINASAFPSTRLLSCMHGDVIVTFPNYCSDEIDALKMRRDGWELCLQSRKPEGCSLQLTSVVLRDRHALRSASSMTGRSDLKIRPVTSDIHAISSLASV